jgi:tungstate transport system substrate-binding protein
MPRIYIAAIIAAITIALTVFIIAVYMVTYCGGGYRILVATTTSLYDTGLLDKLLDEFKSEEPGITVVFIPVGSGEALRMAASGDIDIVLSHAPSMERGYMERGILYRQAIIAYSSFAIVGPRDDPASIRGLDPIDAFARIYTVGVEGGASFVSRGDQSGTHLRELSLWKLTGLNPGGSWYIESGLSMSKTLLFANEKHAYTLTDLSTYMLLRSQGRIDLEVLVANHSLLFNIYSAYLVNPGIIGGYRYSYAEKFFGFLSSSKGQGIISEYTVSGIHIFNPASGYEDKLLEVWMELSKLQ